MFKKDTLLTDISAGVTVGCIAIPLSLAIAIASGVPAEVGLVTAAVSGVFGSMMGGTTLAVTGPAAAISLLVVGAVQQHGLVALPFITLCCGALQVGSGVTRLGAVAKSVPVCVIAGFTTGVGILILTGQLPKALGLAAPAGMNPMELVDYIGHHASAMSPAAAMLAVGTSVAMIMLPKLHRKMPSALVAVGGATVATHAFGLDVGLIGTIPHGLEAFHFGLPEMPPLSSLPSLAASTFVIFSMTSVESLLSCAALEKMKPTSYKHNADQELIGQGLANMGSGMFMGMPVTSVIARSSLNVKLNATSRLPGIVQSGFVFSSIVFLSETIALVPMAALSGVLITTGMGMLNPPEIKHCYNVQKTDIVPFVATIGGMIGFGLAQGIGIGCIAALALSGGNWNQPQTTKLQYREARSVFTQSPLHSYKKLSSLDKGGLMNLILKQQSFEPLHLRTDELHEAFDLVDLDNNGTLDKAELMIAVENLQMDLTAEDVDLMVAEAESQSEPGAITFAAFREVMHAQKTTKSGLFSLAEMQVRHAQRQAGKYGETEQQDDFTLSRRCSFLDDDGHNLEVNPQTSSIWQLNGPINFLSMFVIDGLAQRIRERAGASATQDSIVLDMHGVTSCDFTGGEELINRLVAVAGGKHIKIVNCNDATAAALSQCDPSHYTAQYSVLSAHSAMGMGQNFEALGGDTAKPSKLLAGPIKLVRTVSNKIRKGVTSDDK